LNYDLFRVGIVADTSCRCGASLENLKHFFLDIPIYLEARTTLIGHLTRVVSQGIPSFAHDYLQTGYSYMLSISYLFNNNTPKCIKAKIFPFNQK
jgi:hypothetical protein